MTMYNRKKIELSEASVDGKTIYYKVSEEKGLDLLQHNVVNLFVQFHGTEDLVCDLSKVPQSLLLVPISLYLIPITYFYNVELVIPEMDKVLFERLNDIYEAYSKLYGPFREEWRGKVTVNKIIDNTPDYKTVKVNLNPMIDKSKKWLRSTLKNAEFQKGVQ